MIPCPAPSAPSMLDQIFREGSRIGLISNGESTFFPNAGADKSYRAGVAFGASFRIRWALYTNVTGVYIGSKLTREEAARVTAGLGISFRPMPY